jgi:2-keto-4-pentenoate hydratase/2-oxohepta-3-ene-1,7-dioic acid hydratase in catechol pathway
MSQISLAVIAASVLLAAAAVAQDGVTRYVRYEHNGLISYGVLEGATIHQLEGDLFTGSRRRTGNKVPTSEARLLAPAVPSKVIAVGLNYRSHLGDREPAAYPGLFAKFPTSIVGPDDPIRMTPDVKDLHYEGELVVVIGKKARNVSVEEAPGFVFGVSAGNDVSERSWQRADLQWLRAKGSDSFGPIGPAIVTGLDYGNLALETRLNGEVRQSSNTSDLLFDVPTIVSYVSRYVTLQPGDVIFTGTPGTTAAMKPGDVVEIEIEGVGVLRNTVAAAR